MRCAVLLLLLCCPRKLTKPKKAPVATAAMQMQMQMQMQCSFIFPANLPRTYPNTIISPCFSVQQPVKTPTTITSLTACSAQQAPRPHPANDPQARHGERPPICVYPY
ncbi:hypothetical protein B0T16DRAFT_186920 [Cercophora newfieldiana]|uniref:Secreted protein n=1 Tax=Cercophora newfieldiana TaxID=92897 RepID=A0AA39Y0C2_9PEZI|nr:hypothetical protein B0T16DRAFT_186920 [Cercophora newfieldiana]